MNAPAASPAPARSISQWRRLLWHVNRSPVAPAIKTVLRARHRGAVGERRRLLSELRADPRTLEAGAALARDGHASFDSIVDPAVLTALDEAGRAKLARADDAQRAQQSGHKAFWTRLLDEDKLDGRLPTDNPFVRFALQPNVLAAVGRALGELPQLDDVLLTLSRPTDAPLSYSQLWHLDHDDVRTIKVFVYLTDVADLGDGPFTFLPGPASDRFGFSVKSHRRDDAILRRARPEEIVSVTAPRLSTFAVETSRCLHMGSRVKPGHSRLLYTASYISVPRLFPEPPLRFATTGTEDAPTRCVLTPAR
jgi:hypothetical protein